MTTNETYIAGLRSDMDVKDFIKDLTPERLEYLITQKNVLNEDQQYIFFDLLEKLLFLRRDVAIDDLDDEFTEEEKTSIKNLIGKFLTMDLNAITDTKVLLFLTIIDYRYLEDYQRLVRSEGTLRKCDEAFLRMYGAGARKRLEKYIDALKNATNVNIKLLPFFTDMKKNIEEIKEILVKFGGKKRKRSKKYKRTSKRNKRNKRTKRNKRKSKRKN
jgi:hypothetical protein